MSTSIDRAPARSATRDLAQIAVFAALIVVLGLPGQISIGSAGVPITLQTLGVMLAGALLGWRKGALSVLALARARVALPLPPRGPPPLTPPAPPTPGLPSRWLPAVIVIGLLTALMMPRYRLVPGLLVNILGGLVVIYAFGVVGMLIRTELTLTAAIAANGVFVPGDLAKAVVTAVVAQQVHRARPGLIAPLRRQRATRA